MKLPFYILPLKNVIFYRHNSQTKHRNRTEVAFIESMWCWVWPSLSEERKECIYSSQLLITPSDCLNYLLRLLYEHTQEVIWSNLLLKAERGLSSEQVFVQLVLKGIKDRFYTTSLACQLKCLAVTKKMFFLSLSSFWECPSIELCFVLSLILQSYSLNFSKLFSPGRSSLVSINS